MNKRLVVVSNRLPAFRSPAAGQPKVPAGGLASAVFGALKRYQGSIWFGWSGKVTEDERAGKLTRTELDGTELVGIPLTQRELDDYYLGFCNDAIWPLFHSFQGKAIITHEQEAMYSCVQSRFANALYPLLKPGDLVWIHDYHLLYLGRELRRLGWTGKIGFFLHIPFPSRDLWQLMPDPKEALRALMDCDVIGFHTQGYLDNYIYTCRTELRARWNAPVLSAGRRTQRVGVFPVGIDPNSFLPGTERRGVLRRMVRDRSLILGVDRLDYTKGIPERLLALEQFFLRYDDWRRKAIFLQIASPSRTEIPQYAEQRQRIESLMGRINGEIGEHDWIPARYLYRTYARDFLARLYRDADVGLITPLRDGMNLVAKEFVAAQDPSQPGVLVLSRTAGAAEDLREALIVNPFVASEVADAIQKALTMPLEERQKRHEALLARVIERTADNWGNHFLEALDAPVPSRAKSAITSGPPRRTRPYVH